VFDHAGAVVAAMSISGLRPDVIGDRSDNLVAQVLESAQAISRNLGFTGETSANAVAEVVA
jgi:DNA-binding IclR family transcriptional regulator